MRINLISACNKMPNWVDTVVNDYRQRLGADIQFNIIDIPLNKRTKNSNVEKLIHKEGQQMLKSAKPNDYLIALAVDGKRLRSEQMAAKFEQFMVQGENLSLFIGGPEGLSEQCTQACKEKWSLSDLTLPHPLAKVLIAEQIYRCWSILHKHPYHK